MSEFFDSSIEDKKIIIDTDKLKSDSRKLRKLSRKLQDDKAKVIFNYFYDVYKKSYFIRITETLKSEELKEAKELCSQYPSFSSEFFIEAIDWFLQHKFHQNYVVNIEKLRKNFPKFLKEHGITKSESEIKIK